MKDKKDLNVIQIRIFEVDSIPYDYLMRPDFIEHIKSEFRFQKHEMPFEPYPKNQPRILLFVGGEVTIGKEKIIIQKLLFENRRILIDGMSDSSRLDKVFEIIGKEIAKFDPTGNFSHDDVVFKTEETNCLVHLNVDFKKFFSQKFWGFVSKDAPSFLTERVMAIVPKNLSFELHFDPKNEYAEKHNITLSPKTLTIEPRVGVSIDKRIFYTQSPYDSTTHFRLLEAFEERFTD